MENIYDVPFTLKYLKFFYLIDWSWTKDLADEMLSEFVA